MGKKARKEKPPLKKAPDVVVDKKKTKSPIENTKKSSEKKDTSPQVIKGTVARLAYGGSGVLKGADGRVFFVPFTAPKDTIEAEVVSLKKNYGMAKLLKVVSPSPERLSPPCPYFGTCGGCQLQHIRYEAQLAYKLETVQRALNPVNPSVKAAIFSSKETYGYRRHITLSLKPKGTGYRAGLIGVDGKSLIEISNCLIFTAPEKSPMLEIEKLLSSFERDENEEGRLRLIKTDSEKFILAFHFKKPPKNSAALIKDSLSDTIQGILISAPRLTYTAGNTDMTLLIQGKRFKTHPFAFLQNHEEVSLKILGRINTLIKQRAPESMIDLYSGIGVTSLLASPYVKKIQAVEANTIATALAKKNAEDLGIKNVLFHSGTCEKLLNRVLSKKADLAVVNPPREGLSFEVCQGIGQGISKEILYVSCDPLTLSRDGIRLKDFGFSLEKAEAFDMFPETGHVETLALFSRR